jgi:proteasome lid subunit RPN8/RPN11
MTPEQVEVLKRYAEDSHPFECCGVIGNDGAVLLCGNAAKNKATAFSIPQRELQLVERAHGIGGIWHSHVDAPSGPSSADLAQAHYFGLPYIIVTVRRGVAREVREYVLEGTPESKRFRVVTGHGQ